MTQMTLLSKRFVIVRIHV